MATEKQNLAKARNWAKYRLTGLHTPSEGLSMWERSKIREILQIKQLLLDNWDSETEGLGLNVNKDRCCIDNCKNKGKHLMREKSGHKDLLCKKHYKWFTEQNQ